MLQIKTIRNRLDNPILFDDEVNAALRDGWVDSEKENRSAAYRPVRVRLYAHDVVCRVGEGGR